MEKLDEPVVNRYTGEQLHGGATLAAIVDLHAKWLRGERDGVQADLTEADLTEANLTGANLTEADLTEANLTGANLTGANLTEADLTEANLTGANLTEANLTWANLTGADLTRANLTGANLTEANLTWANLTGAKHKFVIPAIERIHSAVYAAAAQPEALNMGDWHTCETTHCRAGWLCRLAGMPGAVLESFVGTGAAAALIYVASDPNLERVPNFFATNNEALADMKRLAEQEAAATK